MQVGRTDAVPIWNRESIKTQYIFRLQKRVLRIVFNLNKIQLFISVFQDDQIPSLYFIHYSLYFVLKSVTTPNAFLRYEKCLNNSPICHKYLLGNKSMHKHSKSDENSLVVSIFSLLFITFDTFIYLVMFTNVRTIKSFDLFFIQTFFCKLWWIT